ncbi:MAG: MBL fold metallo-hydrolase [Acidobacteriaceae bacterium]
MSLLSLPYPKSMLHEVFPVGPLGCNCSIVADESTREAMVIDPGDEIERILLTLAKHHLTLKQIVITHAHIDHIGGAMKLKASTGAPILLNENDEMLLKLLDAQAAWIGMKPPGTVEYDQHLGDGARLTTGAIQSEIIHTPGHTEGSLCIYIPAEKTLLAGDTLFAGSIGRTDLPGGSFEKIIRSIKNKLTVLPEDTLVVPGHGASTTIGEEKQSNPFLTER